MFVTGYPEDRVEIREVWQCNLHAEMGNICNIAISKDFPYIAMDTEFPGTVFNGENINRYTYEAVRGNVNMTKLIQLGLCFSSSRGFLPSFGSTKHIVWQFNFREFDPTSDPCNPESIQLLRRSGIDFEKNKVDGVDISEFKRCLMSTGILINNHMRWVTFHGASDFGYLLKMITDAPLPECRLQFCKLVKCYFPVVYDLKHVYSKTEYRDLGLNRIAEMEGCVRVGAAHLAGSDCLLTLLVFMRKKREFGDSGILERFAGVVYGV